MSLCSDGSTDESESSEEEELITWRYQKSTKHGANVCFRPEVVVEQPNKQRKQIGVQNNLTFKFVRSSTSLIRNILTVNLINFLIIKFGEITQVLGRKILKR